jgi:type I restriction enzyme, S subunit
MALSLSPTEIVRRGEHRLLGKAAHWERVRLGDVADVQNGFAFRSELFDRVTGVPLIRIRDVNSTTTEHRYAGDYDPAFIVRRGEIIVGMDGDFKAARWQGGDALLNQRVCRLTLHSDAFAAGFFFLCLQPYLNAINAETSSLTVKHLSSRSVEDIPLPLPPLREQHRIVAKVEELFSELDKAAESLTLARAQLKTYRKALLKAAFEGKLTAGWRAANRDKLECAEALLTRIRAERDARKKQTLEEWRESGVVGRAPRKLALFEATSDEDSTHPVTVPAEGWSSARIGDLFDVCIGATPSRKRAEYWGGSINWVSSGEVQFCTIASTKERITEAGLRSISADIHPAGTVMLGMIGEGKTRGQAAILTAPATHNQNCAAIRVEGSPVPPGYLYRFLQYMYDATRQVGSGNNQKALNKQRIQKMTIPLASPREMERIVEELEAHLSRVDAVEGGIDTTTAEINVLRQSILKQAFSGQLVPQDATDEPATALLARLREKVPDPRTRRRKAA